MNKLDKQYQQLLQDILDNGISKDDRTGTGTISVFGRQIRHKMAEGFPLLTTKKMPFKLIVTELLWFLRGDTNIKFLVDNNCHIWDGDAYKNYAKLLTRDFHGPHYSQKQFIDLIKTNPAFAKDFGELGPIYGAQWRSWRVGKGIETTLRTDDGETIYEAGSMYIDQIANLINDLKSNPDSRRLMVNAWNVGELGQMVLPPCHYGFQVYTRELDLEERRSMVTPEMHSQIYTGGDSSTLSNSEIDQWNIPTRAISLMWNQRSVDTFLGLPFNIASYGLLLEIIAKMVNMVPDELIGNLGDVHLYSNHIEQAIEQIGRELTFEEKLQWVINNTDVEMENLYITEAAFALERKTREPYDLPNLVINSGNENWHLLEVDEVLNTFDVDLTFNVKNYESHPIIKAPLSN